MMSTPEGDTKNIIKKFLKKNNIWHLMIVPSTYGRSTGISDFQCLHKGTFFVIEAKRGDKPDSETEPTPNQIGYMESVRENGGYAFVVRRQEDLKPVEEFIAQITTRDNRY